MPSLSEAAVHSARRHALKTAQDLNVPEAADHVRIAKGDARLRRVELTRTRLDGSHEHGESIDLAFGGLEPSATGYAEIARNVATTARRILRRRALEQSGWRPGDVEPAWSFVVHPLQRALLSQDDTLQRLVEWGPRIEDLRLCVSRWGWSNTYARIEGDVIQISGEPAGTNHHGIGDNPAIIWVRGTTIPETALTALPGSPLGSAIALPFTTDGLTISDVFHDGDRLVFAVAGKRTPLTEVPDGVDSAWLEIPWSEDPPPF